MCILKLLHKSVGLLLLAEALVFQITLGQDYYYGLGVQPLTKVDSIITIKFDPSYPQNHWGTFAYEIDALDTDHCSAPHLASVF
jgi:hypothetical protein